VINSVVLVGRVATDVTLRYTPNGQPVAQFRLAVDRPSRDKENRKTDFIPVVTWGKAAEAAARYLQKGRLAGVRGRLQIREYQDREGARRWATEVVGVTTFLPDGKQRNGDQATAPAAEAAEPETATLPEVEAADELGDDEDVPF
jgi:single-strand DNA-binding protein